MNGYSYESVNVKDQIADIGANISEEEEISESGKTKIDVRLEGETVWLSQLKKGG